jgi:hypothetical protein
MTTFQDGPAKGQTLLLKRAPRFLRVVEWHGKWDALDQLEDEPRPDEKIYAYEIIGETYMMHLNRGRDGGGFYAGATYKQFLPQPDDATMRDTNSWVKWCHENK